MISKRDKCLMCAALAAFLVAGHIEGSVTAADGRAAHKTCAEVQEHVQSKSIAEVAKGIRMEHAVEIKPIPATDEELTILAQIVWAEARGVSSKREQAAVIWCILNRVDAGFGDSIKAVTTAPNQFAWSSGNPAPDEYMELAVDVLQRWQEEKDGQEDTGRVLPSEYLYFSGDGKQNYFRDEWKKGNVWDWSLPDPYEDEQDETVGGGYYNVNSIH